MIKPKTGKIPFSAIEAGERFRKEYLNVDELAADIADRGLLHPLVVSEKEDGSGYMLCAGGRRLMAMAVLQWKDIPCNIYPPLDEYDLRSIELAENIQREDLSFAERAALVKEVHELYQKKFGEAYKSSSGGHSLADTADLLGMSKMSVSREIKLANAIEMIPELANCKDASQARKMAERFEEAIIREELAKRADVVLSHEGADAIKRQLISNFHVGDFFVGVKKLPSKSFHLIEIDPPYAIDIKKAKKDDSGGTKDYNEIKAKDYPDFIKAVIEDSDRLLFDNGWLLLWFGMHPWYCTILEMLRDHGYSVIHPGIWTKRVGQTQWPDRYLASCYEPFFYARKGDAVLFKQGRPNVFDISPIDPNKKIHPTERPIALMMEILQCFVPPSGRIAVPFAGSGNTLLAAHNLGMQAVGFDLSENYKNAYIQKIMEGEVGRFE